MVGETRATDYYLVHTDFRSPLYRNEGQVENGARLNSPINSSLERLSCTVLVLLPDLELLPGLACRELLDGHPVDLASDLLLHLGNLLFSVHGLCLSIVEH